LGGLFVLADIIVYRTKIIRGGIQRAMRARCFSIGDDISQLIRPRCSYSKWKRILWNTVKEFFFDICDVHHIAVRNPSI
jgi:hypothetical protein